MRTKPNCVIGAGLIMFFMYSCLMLIGCGNSGEGNANGDSFGTDIETIREGILLMGSDIANPPFEIGEGDEITGFDVDIAREIARRMGLELLIVPTERDWLVNGLKMDKFDMIMSALKITDERKLEIDFSNPYMEADLSICVLKESDILSESDLKDRTVAVRTGTTGHRTAEKMEGLREIITFNSFPEIFESVESGMADAAIIDYPVGAYLNKMRGHTEIAKKIITEEHYGIGVKKGNDSLLDAINHALESIEADGTYEEIVSKWFDADMN